LVLYFWVWALCNAQQIERSAAAAAAADAAAMRDVMKELMR